MSPVSKLLLLRPALLQVPATLSRTVRPLSSQPLTRAMLLRAPPVASVVVGTATAIVTEKIASKLVDKVADEAATKAVETAKTAVAAVTGLDLDTESEGKDGKDEDGSAGSKTRSAWATTSATNSSAPMGQRRAISTRTSINVTPQKNQQPYDYKPISDIDSIADAIGPEHTRDALNDAHGAAAESSTKAATERHLKAASTNPTGTEESQQLKETVKGFVGSIAADGKDMWKDTKNEFGEAVEITKDVIHDTAQSIKGTVGKVLGAGMGDATKAAENSQSMFTTGADIVGNKADDAKDTAAAATSTAHDAYAAVKDKAQDSSSTAADKITDSYTSAKDKAQDIYVSAADRAKATANKAEDMYSHAADRAEDAVLASRAKAAHVAQDALGTAAGMADSARAMGHEAVDKTKAKAGQVKEKVMDATHNMTGQAKVAADQIEGKYHEAKAGAMGAAAGYAAGMAGKSAIERAKETAMGGGGGSAPGAMAGMDDLPVGHTMNDYLDEVEDRIRGGDVRGRRSKL